MEFRGANYMRSQMRELQEKDDNAMNPFFDWVLHSKPYEYTMYRTYIVFHTPAGFIACYADDIDNYWSI